ncbi:hypothetical protein D3C75_1323600 [compost metagenome]
MGNTEILPGQCLAKLQQLKGFRRPVPAGGVLEMKTLVEITCELLYLVFGIHSWSTLPISDFSFFMLR